MDATQDLTVLCSEPPQGKVFVLNNSCRIKPSVKMNDINNPQQEYSVRSIFVLLHNYKNIQTVRENG